MLNYTGRLKSYPNVKLASQTPNKIKVSILSKSDITEASELFSRSFTEGEPLCKYLKITYDDFLPFAKSVMNKAAEDKLSVVATDSDGKIIGLVVGEDITNPLKEGRIKAVTPITSMFDTLSKPFTEKKYKPNTIVHIWATAIREDARGKGLSTLLNNAAVALALSKGYSYVFAEFTNEINERHMQHFPDHLKCELNLKDFIFEGKRPFETLKGKAASYLCTAAPFISIEDLEKCIVS